MLRAEHIHKSYGNLEVLKGVSLEVTPGEVVALVGASGAGKSTLLHILGTLDTPDKGKVFFEDHEITRFPESKQADFRNESLGFVFQFHHLLPEFNALENVCMPAFILGTNRKETEDRAHLLLKELGLEKRVGHKPSQLSGGEQQRVSIARAMMNQPKLILADEPTGNLDSATSQELYQLIFDLAESTKVGFLIATHDLQLAEKAGRVRRIVDGRFLE
ncbi:MAG: ABC transporter ATP-binding protein [Bacteroidota bacterium]